MVPDVHLRTFIPLLNMSIGPFPVLNLKIIFFRLMDPKLNSLLTLMAGQTILMVFIVLPSVAHRQHYLLLVIRLDIMVHFKLNSDEIRKIEIFKKIFEMKFLDSKRKFSNDVLFLEHTQYFLSNFSKILFNPKMQIPVLGFILYSERRYLKIFPKFTFLRFFRIKV